MAFREPKQDGIGSTSWVTDRMVVGHRTIPLQSCPGWLLLKDSLTFTKICAKSRGTEYDWGELHMEGIFGSAHVDHCGEVITSITTKIQQTAVWAD